MMSPVAYLTSGDQPRRQSFFECYFDQRVDLAYRIYFLGLWHLSHTAGKLCFMLNFLRLIISQKVSLINFQIRPLFNEDCVMLAGRFKMTGQMWLCGVWRAATVCAASWLFGHPIVIGRPVRVRTILAVINFAQLWRCNVLLGCFFCLDLQWGLRKYWDRRRLGFDWLRHKSTCVVVEFCQRSALAGTATICTM